MFKNHALHVQMVKTNATKHYTSETVGCNHLDPEKIDEIIQVQVEHTAIVAVAAIAAVTVLRAVCEIIVNNTNPQYR